jgi:CHAT domain-containing protein
MKQNFDETNINFDATLIDIANAYYKLGNYKEALPLYERGLKFTKKRLGENNEYYALLLNGLAMLNVSLGKYEEALPLFEKALSIIKNVFGEDHADYSVVLNNLASLYENTNRYKEALQLYEHASSIIEKLLGEAHPRYASSLNDIANLYVNIGSYNKALPLFQKAMEITRTAVGEDHPQYARNLNNQANLYFWLKQYDSAFHLYSKALSLRKKSLGKEHPDNVASLNGLGLLYSIYGNKETASSLLKEANQIELNHLIRTYSTLSEHEKMIFLNKELFKFSYLPSLLYRGHQDPSVLPQVYNNELVLKGMVLRDKKQILSTIRKVGDSSYLALYKSWQFNNILIGRQMLLPISQRASYLDSLVAATTQQEQQFSREASKVLQNVTTEVVSVKDISMKLNKQEAAIEFIRFKLYSNAWTDSMIYAAIVLLPGDTIGKFVPLFEEKQLARLLRPYGGSTTSYEAIKRLYMPGKFSDSLYQLIWKPLEGFLSNTITIYYAPTGLLHRVSFQAMRSNASDLLIDRFRLNQVLSTRSVVQPVVTKYKPTSVGIWGNIKYDRPQFINDSKLQKPQLTASRSATTSSSPVFTYSNRSSPGKDWKSLPGSKQEILHIQEVFKKAGTQVIIDSGSTAKEERFKNLDGFSPAVLHIATHGFFLPVAQGQEKRINDIGSSINAFSLQQNPMFRSGLVLSGGNEAWRGKPVSEGMEDGILTAYEIAQMDLNHTDLVVLSACETALGDVEGNEGVIGLQRAFKMAGVKEMIMSLWKVPDQETMQLMTSFYKNLLNGSSAREALYSAQSSMRQKYPPYYWAAFVLVE